MSFADPDAWKGEDLSREIAASVERLPSEVVRCTRVGLDRYRCNWWAPHDEAPRDGASMPGSIVTTHRVRRSRFLRVTRAQTGALDMAGSATQSSDQPLGAPDPTG